MSGHYAHCFLKTLAVLKPGQSKLLQSCINQALMLLNHQTAMQWDKKWAICRCRVAAWWWIETFEIVFAALHKALSLVLFGYSWCSLPGYLIKNQQIISPNTSCGYSSTHVQYTAHRQTDTMTLIALNGNNILYRTESSSSSDGQYCMSDVQHSYSIMQKRH